jgi:hypothetical protein
LGVRFCPLREGADDYVDLRYYFGGGVGYRMTTPILGGTSLLGVGGQATTGPIPLNGDDDGGAVLNAGNIAAMLVISGRF